MSTIQSELEKLNKEVVERTAEAGRLARLSVAFPDLQKHVGRWNKVAYYSPSVNSKVERFDLRHNCGCCSDSPLEIWPYLETPDGRVYSDPPCFQVGEKHYLGGDKPYPKWKEKLEAAGLPEVLIGAISVHFRVDKEARVQASYEDDEVIEDPEPLV
jgi:hypothetical protein